jgi:hypothetical protein
MIDTSMYGRMGGFDSGLRMGQAIGGVVSGVRDSGLRDKALQRIQAGEDYNAVVQEVMQQSPQVAQELLNLRQQNMKAQSDQQGMQRTEQLIQIGDMQLERSKLEQSAIPLFGAAMVTDDAAQQRLLEEAATPFAKSNPEVSSTIRDIGKQPPEVRMQAITGIIKTLRQAGVYPDDPSQLAGQGTALGQNLALLDQARQSGDKEREQLILRNMDPEARAVAQGGAKVSTEQMLNPVIAEREAAKVSAKEQTATGSAELQQKQLQAEKLKSDQAKSAREKENSIAAINQQLQQIGVLAKHPGFDRAVGASSVLPSLPGGKAFDFERQLDKLDAQSFMAMIPNLSGMGALSNAEGQKVSAALSALSTGMSEGGFKQELKTIQDTLVKARDRITSGNLLDIEQPATQRNEADIFAEYGL